MPHEPIGTITSLNASLMLVVFDAANATEWVPTKPAATKAQFTGHPAEVMRGLSKGEEACAIDVGPSSGWAFELEGKSGRVDAYRPGDATLVLVAPPRAWWAEHHAENLAEVDALLADLGTNDDATEIGELELSSGKLAIVYLWLKKVGAARDLVATVPPNGALGFGDGYGEGHSGLIVDLGKGRYQLSRVELQVTDCEQPLVAMYFVRR